MRSGPSSPRRRRTATRDDPADDRKGDSWDHVAFDAESRLVVSVVPGERTAENVEAVVEDFKRRTGGRLMDLITTDDYPAYEDGDPATPTARRSRRPGPASGGAPRPRTRSPPAGLTYAMVEKTREKGRVVEIAHAGGLRHDGGGAGGAGDVERRAGRSTRRSWSGRTGRTGTATPGRPARRTGSRRTGGITRRSPT